MEIVTDINFAFSCCSWQDLSLEKEVKEFDKSGEELLEGLLSQYWRTSHEDMVVCWLMVTLFLNL